MSIRHDKHMYKFLSFSIAIETDCLVRLLVSGISQDDDQRVQLMDVRVPDLESAQTIIVSLSDLFF